MKLSRLALLALSLAALLSADGLNTGSASGGGPSVTANPDSPVNSSASNTVRGGLVASISSSTVNSLENEGFNVTNSGNKTVIGVSRNSTIHINSANVSTANSILPTNAVAVQLNSSKRNITITSSASGGGQSPSTGAAGGTSGGASQVTITSTSAGGFAVPVTSSAEVTVRNGSVYQANSATAISVYPSDLAPAPLPSPITVKLLPSSGGSAEFEYSSREAYNSGDPILSVNSSFTASFQPGVTGVTVNSTRFKMVNVSAPIQIRARNASLAIRSINASSLNLTQGSVSATVNTSLQARNNALFAGNAQVSLLPEAMEMAVAAQAGGQVEGVSLSDSGGSPEYSLQVSKNYRFLALFPVRVTLPVKVNAETGVVSEVGAQPWWSALSTDAIPLKEGDSLSAE